MHAKSSVKKWVCAKHVAQSNSRSVNRFQAAPGALLPRSRRPCLAAFFISVQRFDIINRGQSQDYSACLRASLNSTPTLFVYGGLGSSNNLTPTLINRPMAGWLNNADSDPDLLCQ